LVDPTAGKDPGATGEGHALCSLDHQQFGRAARTLAHDDQCCGWNGVVAHRRQT
jgi:hypothetical protein